MIRLCWLLAMVVAALVAPAPGHAGSRIKDIADVEGVRDNMLVGYGLVVGLDGSGDSLRNAPFTRQSLQSMLERLGVSTRNEDLNTRNVAAVMVTARLPPFAAAGSRIDVQVSAIGDAKSLSGGTLLVTPLLGADQQVYAVAQGAVAIGGFAAQGASGSSVKQGAPTNARIANGALVERELGFDLAGQDTLRLSLRNPDFTTARRMASAINDFAGGGVARAANPSTVEVRAAGQNMVELITDIEQLVVQPDQAARIVVDEATGVVVMGDDVRVSRVAIAQGNLTITVREQPQVSQPNALARGDTVVTPQSNVEVEEERGGLAIVEGARLRDLVDGLNALGVSPRDLLSILQSLKAAGALQAEIEVL